MAGLALLAGAIVANPLAARPDGPVIQLSANTPTRAAEGEEVVVELGLTNAGPGEIADLGLELLSFRADIAALAFLESDPPARLGRVQYPFHSRTFLFGRLAAGQNGRYTLRFRAPMAGDYPLRLALDEYGGDPLGRPLRTPGGGNAAADFVLKVRPAASS